MARQPPLQHQDQHDPCDPDHGRGGDCLAMGQPFDEAGDLVDQARGADLEPEQLSVLAEGSTLPQNSVSAPR